MAQSFLIFDFGKNEEAAQQARHRIESWKQAFRLGDKLAMKFERVEEETKGAEADGEERPAAQKKGAKKKPPKQEEGSKNAAEIRILVRLSFSDHEKLSHQRWVDRIPGEEPFKAAKGETVRQGDPEFAKTSDLFDSLD